MRLEDYDSEQRLTATVKESSLITPEGSEAEIRNIVLSVGDAADFGFSVGQSIGVVVPGPHEFGQSEHFRRNHGTTGPGLDWPPVIFILGNLNFLQQVKINERSFF